MANGTPAAAPTPAPVATPAPAEQPAGKHEQNPQPDTTTASPPTAQAVIDASGDTPTADVVAVVSRDVNGDPAQSRNYGVLVAPDAPEHIKDAHHNRAGEALGAVNVRRTSTEIDPASLGVPGLSGDELAEHQREEARQLSRINSGKHLADLA